MDQEPKDHFPTANSERLRRELLTSITENTYQKNR